MPHTLFIVASVVVLGGCHAVGYNSSDRATPREISDVSSAVSICALSAGGHDIGDSVTIQATYHTDTSHYAYFLSKDCGEDGVINVADYGPYNEKSVASFYRQIESACLRAKKGYLCVIELEVTADITLAADSNGERVVEIARVHSSQVSSLSE